MINFKNKKIVNLDKKACEILGKVQKLGGGEEIILTNC